MRNRVNVNIHFNNMMNAKSMPLLYFSSFYSRFGDFIASEQSVVKINCSILYSIMYTFTLLEYFSFVLLYAILKWGVS